MGPAQNPVPEHPDEPSWRLLRGKISNMSSFSNRLEINGLPRSGEVGRSYCDSETNFREFWNFSTIKRPPFQQPPGGWGYSKKMYGKDASSAHLGASELDFESEPSKKSCITELRRSWADHRGIKALENICMDHFEPSEGSQKCYGSSCRSSVFYFVNFSIPNYPPGDMV